MLFLAFGVLADGVLADGLLAFLAVVGLLCAEPRDLMFALYDLSFKCCHLHVALENLVLGKNPRSHRDVV